MEIKTNYWLKKMMAVLICILGFAVLMTGCSSGGGGGDDDDDQAYTLYERACTDSDYRYTDTTKDPYHCMKNLYEYVCMGDNGDFWYFTKNPNNSFYQYGDIANKGSWTGNNFMFYTVEDYATETGSSPVNGTFVRNGNTITITFTSTNGTNIGDNIHAMSFTLTEKRKISSRQINRCKKEHLSISGLTDSDIF